MVLLNQAVKKVFMLGFSDQTKLNGLEFFNVEITGVRSMSGFSVFFRWLADRQ